MKAPKTEKPAKAAPEAKAPIQPETPPAAPAEAPRPAKDKQIVYLKLSDLHTFKNHPFQVRNDEEKAPTYFPQLEQGEPYKKIHARSGTSPNYGKFERQGSESSDGWRYPGNVLAFQTVAHTIHPTQKPMELCEYLIKTYTRPGEVVVDICAGSGTTAVAALNTGRRFVCFETAPAFYSAAVGRMEQARRALASGGAPLPHDGD